MLCLRYPAVNAVKAPVAATNNRALFEQFPASDVDIYLRCITLSITREKERRMRGQLLSETQEERERMLRKLEADKIKREKQVRWPGHSTYLHITVEDTIPNA